MTNNNLRPSWHRAIIVLSSVVVTAILIGLLYWARPILLPIALAIFFAFLLNPLVVFLHGRGLRRVPAVLIAVGAAGIVVVGVGSLLATQLYDLADGLPQYKPNIKARVESLRDMGKDSLPDRLSRLFDEVTESQKKPDTPTRLPLDGKETAVVAVESSGGKWFVEATSVLGSLVEILAGGALGVALVIFMLLKREDLRNRVIWVTGRGHLTLTTKALDDVGQRISRYLLMQLAINSMYGLAMTIGLAFIGVEHVILWGFLAGVMRYVPYLGAPLSAVFPFAQSLAQFTGWTEPLLVVGLVVVLELVVSNFIEPTLYGKSIGLSEVALLVAAGFWTFLWGPIGLILSGPLTVCLFVLGQYVPGLRFLAVLLGDEPALEPDATLYQRLAAGDQDEAADIVAKYVKDHPPEQVYDGLLIPALSHVRKAEERDELAESDEQFIRQAASEIVAELGEDQRGQSKAPEKGGEEMASPAHEPRKTVRILGCPARDEWDVLSLNMLQNLLDTTKWEMEVVGPTMLASELLPLINDKAPAVVVIGAPPPGGLSHTRYLCKRLRNHFPKLKIVVGRWGLRTAVDQNLEQLHASGADEVHASVRETVALLSVWLPVLHEQQHMANRSFSDLVTNDKV